MSEGFSKWLRVKWLSVILVNAEGIILVNNWGYLVNAEGIILVNNWGYLVNARGYLVNNWGYLVNAWVHNWGYLVNAWGCLVKQLKVLNF